MIGLLCRAPRHWRVICFGIVTGLLSLAPSAHAAEYFVAPDGQPTNDGSISRPLDLRTALSAASPARPGDTIWLRGGTYSGYFRSDLVGTISSPIVVRVYQNEKAVLDGIGIADRWSQTNVLDIRGADVQFWNLEVRDSLAQRSSDANNPPRPIGISVYGQRIKVINPIIHDVGRAGIGLWNSGDTEVYGAVVFNNGAMDPLPAGHGFYIQNNVPGTSTRVSNSVSFNNFQMGMHGYGEGGTVEGLAIDEFVAFNNGSPSLGTSRRDANLFVGPRTLPADRISVTRSHTYHPSFTAGLSARFGYTAANRNLVVRGNYFMSGSTPVTFTSWDAVTFEGNTVYATKRPAGMTYYERAIVAQTLNRAGPYIFGGNTYYDQTTPEGGTTYHPFEIIPNPTGFIGTFPQWQAAKGDWTSTYHIAVPPDRVFVLPNKYERGRAHVVVYNWSRRSSVTIDLSQTGLMPGEAFNIWDVQNLAGAPLLSGTYSSALVTVPMTMTSVAQPLGWTQAIAHTDSEYGVLLVRPATAAAPAPGPVPTVSLTSPANGYTTTAPANLTLAATASIVNDTVRDVSFYAGTQLIGTDTTSPYSVSWSNVPAGTYVLQARVTGVSGVTATSNTATVTMNAPATPVATVSLTSPVTGYTATAPASLTVEATASMVNDTIRDVSFYAGTQLIGTDTTSPYSVSWTNVAAGIYAVQARVTGGSGVTATSNTATVTIKAPTTPVATVSLTSPVNGYTAIAPASLTVAATASIVNDTIRDVAFYAGTQLIGTDTTSPYSVPWMNVPAGTYAVQARVTGASGVTATSNTATVTITAPTGAPVPSITLTSPVNGYTATAPAHLTLTAAASIVNDTVLHVAFYSGTQLLGIDSVAPYSFNWNNVPAGTYVLQARVTGRTAVTALSNTATVSIGSASAPPTIPTAGTATFLRTDSQTRGNWKGVYGAQGHAIASETAAIPPYAAVVPNGWTWIWASTTTDTRALQRPTTGYRAATWYANTFVLDLTFTDGKAHQVALYMVDWELAGRAQQAEVVDAATGAVLDRRSISGFGGGQYWIWSITGKVKINVIRQAGPNAVVSGMFIDGDAVTAATAVQSQATFLKLDSTTRGDWKGRYGTQGYGIANDVNAFPAFAQVTHAGSASWTWVSSTADGRALQSSTGGRIASTWYNNNFTIDVGLTDGQSHQIALHAIDWDSAGRGQTIEVLDPLTRAVLDRRTLSSFTGGQYLVWRVTGRVIFSVTRTAGSNAVVGGVFVD